MSKVVEIPHGTATFDLDEDKQYTLIVSLQGASPGLYDVFVDTEMVGNLYVMPTGRAMSFFTVNSIGDVSYGIHT